MPSRQYQPAAPLIRALSVATALGLVVGCSEPPPAPDPAASRPVASATQPAAGSRGTVDTVRLESLEELTESFANALLDFSFAARQGEELDGYLAPVVVAAVPTGRGEPRPEWKWLTRRDWTIPAAPREHARADVLNSLESILGHFVELEDVRFKVTDSEVDSVDAQRVSGEFKCWIVGRNGESEREWARGHGEVSGRLSEDGWELDRFAFTDLSSVVAAVDLFSEVSGPAGVTHDAPSFDELGRVALVSHGAATADVDGDGLLDIFATGESRNFLYLSRGDGTFEESALRVGLSALPRVGIAPVFLDHDGDGDQDLFITAIGGQYFFENLLVPSGRLRFRDVSERAGVDVSAFAFSASAGDLNGDGRPDLIAASYNDYGRVLPDRWEGATNGTPNPVFINQGDGTFREAGAELGLAGSRWSYAVTLADIDDDSDLDVLVANDFGGPNALYLREGERFVDVAEERGLGAPGYGMGVDFGDYDNDGDLDVHVSKMSSTAGQRILGRLSGEELPGHSTLELLASGNSLYENVGGGQYREVSETAGPFGGGWAWGGGFLDVDNDGFQDVYTPNGFISGKSFKDT